MVTRLKNISYSGVTKLIMFVVATICVIAFIYNVSKFWEYDNYSGITSNYLQGCDKYKGTDYYKPFTETYEILAEELSSLENVSLLVQDNGEHTMQEILDLDLDEYIARGIDFYMIDMITSEIISTSDKSLEESEYYKVSDNYGIRSYTTNTELLKIIDLYDDYSEKVVEFTYDENGEMLSSAKGMLYHPYMLYIMYTDENVENEVSAFRDSVRDRSVQSIINSVTSVFIFLLTLIYFMIVAGRTNKNDEVNLKMIDRIYFDILCVGALIGLSFTSWIYYEGLYLKSIWFTQTQQTAFLIIYAIIISTTCVYAVSNFSIKIKTKKFLDSLFVFVVLRFIYRKTLKVLYKFFIIDTTWTLRILSILGVFFAFIGLVVPGLSIFIDLMFFGLLISSVGLVNAIKVVANNEKYVADKKLRNIPFNTSLEQLEAISKNTNEVYIKGLKAQNTKTELITNVSHDLRTPLTSIVGYIDLLEKRGNNYDEETQEYIRILKEKSDRMTQMVGDLFDLAKTSSGDVKLDLSKLDVKKLVEQTVSELDDFIVDENKIQLKLEEKLYILADGNKMYRVIQNLIDNALKYSLDGTRIYIEVFENENEEVQIEFKNIANYEMNFKQDEITERFTRGDKSRTTEGSGLGLAIAETYTNLNGGSFKVVVDGDLFKVVMKIKKV